MKVDSALYRYLILALLGVDSAFTKPAGTCYDSITGGVIIGPDENNNLTIRMYRLNSANDPVPTYEATDGELVADERGRLVFEGRDQSLDNVTNDPLNGNFKAILTDLPVTFPSVQ